MFKRLSIDLSARFGSGFSVTNLWQMRSFYLLWPEKPTPLVESGNNQKHPTPSVASDSSQKNVNISD